MSRPVSRVSRAALRTLVVALVVTSAASAQAGKTPTRTPAPLQVRMSWEAFVSGPGGAQRLASLKKAIARMKSLDTAPPTSPNFRRSWVYWANIHGYYGVQSPDSTVAAQVNWLKANGFSKYVKYYSGIKDMTPPDAIAQAIWATCEHSGGPTQHAVNFFGWHRMYLYYFERVLRWAAGDSTLRLPYWDYTDPANLQIPAELRVATSPFYSDKRNPGMNAGTSQLSATHTNVTSLLSDTSFFRYEYNIEMGIHGYVHCTVGPVCPVALMGDVPVAANDVVFYTHHANIDRLWTCWQRMHTTPGGAWRTQTFSFVDETGAKVTKPVSAFLSDSALGYVYDHEVSCQRSGTPVLMAQAGGAVHQSGGSQDTTRILGAVRSVSINAPQVTVDVAPERQLLGSALSNLEQPHSVELVLRDVGAASDPGVMFDVFLAKKGTPATRQYVGTISWFGAFRSHRGQRKNEPRTLTYDVTTQVRDLGGPSLADGGVSVIIEASQGSVPVDTTKASQATQQAAALFHKQANVRIGAIELRGLPSRTPTKK